MTADFRPLYALARFLISVSQAGYILRRPLGRSLIALGFKRVSPAMTMSYRSIYAAHATLCEPTFYSLEHDTAGFYVCEQRARRVFRGQPGHSEKYRLDVMFADPAPCYRPRLSLTTPNFYVIAVMKLCRRPAIHSDSFLERHRSADLR